MDDRAAKLLELQRIRWPGVDDELLAATWGSSIEQKSDGYQIVDLEHMVQAGFDLSNEDDVEAILFAAALLSRAAAG